LPEFRNTDSGATAHEIMIRGTTRFVRAALGLLMAPFVIAGYAALAGLVLTIAMLRSVFGGRGRLPRRVAVAARSTEFLRRGRPEPSPATV